MVSASFAQGLQILKIDAEKETVSQGQEGLRVEMIVQSGLRLRINNLEAELRFYHLKGNDTDPQDVTDEYKQKRTDKTKSINGQSQVTLTFDVAVSATASAGTVIIDGTVSGVSLLISYSADAANETDSWIVQTPAALSARLDPVPELVMVNQTFDVSARVVNLGTAEIDDSGRLELSVPRDYSITGGKRVRFLQDEVVTWSVVAPGSPTSKPEPIEVKIADAPRELNTDKKAIIVDDSDADSIQVYDNNALNILKIDAYKETISQGQQGIRVDMIVASSQRGPIANVEAALQFYRFSDSDTDQEDLGSEYTRQRIDDVVSIEGSEPDTLRFEVAAAEDASLETVVINGTVSGLSGSVPLIDNDGADETDSWVVQTSAELQVQFTSIGLLQTAGDTFDVRANVVNLGTAGIDDSGELRLFVPPGYSVLSTTPLQQPFVQDIPLLWRVEAPLFPTAAPEPFIVEIVDVPLEINTEQPARVAIATDEDSVQTIRSGTGGVGFIQIDSVRIVAPEGAKDGTLSTDQQLWVAAYVHRADAHNVKPQISFPPGYRLAAGETATKNIPDVAGDFVSVQWQLITPQNIAGPDTIAVTASGEDSETGTIIDNVLPDTVRSSLGASPLAITVQPEAAVRLSKLRINDSDRILTVGQRFAVTGELQKTGAEVQDASLRLSLPSGFTALDDTIRSFDPNSETQLTWLVEAPALPVSLASLRLFWDHAPFDANSNQPAIGEDDSLELVVSVEDLFCLKVLPPGPVPVTIVKGERDVEFTNLQFLNDTNRPMVIHGMTVLVSDRSGVPQNPIGIISRIAVLDGESDEVYSELTSFTQNEMEFNFPQPVPIPSFDVANLIFAIDVGYDVDEEAVQLVIQNPSTDIEAYETGDQQENPVAIRDSRCLEYPGALATDFSSIGEEGLDATFFNYPNPFPRPDLAETSFHYYLPEASDVTIRIYTLFGELVWSKHIAAGEPETSAGLHDGRRQKTVKWDARNGRKIDVLSGVYIAVLKANGEKAMTKVAVAR